MQTNFYEELSLSTDWSIGEISDELNRLESTWKRRELNSPEKATKMLALIIDARAAFSTEESRKKYDASLSGNWGIKSRSSSQPDEANTQYDKAWDEMRSYCESEQWDLAKVAVDKVLSLVDTVDLIDTQKSYTYAMARFIYYNNGFFEQAIAFASQAIAATPDNYHLYKDKETVLFGCIERLKKQGLDASQHEHTYRTTCQVWAKMAKEQDDCVSAAEALYFLAGAYINYQPKNYDLAEQCAMEALTLNPENNGAKEVIRWLDQPKEITLTDLRNYENEISPYEAEIKQLSQQIASSGLTPESDLGWRLTQKSHFGSYNPNKDGLSEEETYTFSYYLNKNGRIILNKKRETEYWQKGSMPWTHNEETDTECSMNEVMKEMDIGCDTYRKPKPGWEEKGTYVGYVSWQFPDPNQTVRLVRKARKKGQELYDKLKSIVDQAAQYIEECNRINAAYNAELEPLRQSVLEKYAAQKEQLLQEQSTMMENAKKGEVQRSAMQSQITTLKSELASLGFFAGKKKRELQATITQLEQSFAQIPTMEAVKATYDKKVEDLKRQESAELLRSEQELRNKYPLPKQ